MEATGGAGWWLLFTITDIVMAAAMILNGCLMEAQVFSGGAPIKFGELGFLTTIFLGVYMVGFGVLSGLSSFIWFTKLGKFIGFFYFMWGRGAAYMVMGTISLNAPWQSLKTPDGGVGFSPIVIFSILVQFVVSVAAIVIGLVYVAIAFIPAVRKMYRPICNVSGPLNVATTEEYWLGKEKFQEMYGGGAAAAGAGGGSGYAPPAAAGRFE